MDHMTNALIALGVRFLNEYGTQILYAVLTALAGGVGFLVRQRFHRHRNRRTRQKAVRQCLTAAAQVYGDLGEKERREKTAEAIAQTLSSRGIPTTQLEAMAYMAQAENADAQQADGVDGDESAPDSRAMACVPRPYSPSQ